MDNPVKKWYSRTLNITSEPEEKRKIIGDTFIQVCKIAKLPVRLQQREQVFLIIIFTCSYTSVHISSFI